MRIRAAMQAKLVCSRFYPCSVARKREQQSSFDADSGPGCVAGPRIAMVMYRNDVTSFQKLERQLELQEAFNRVQGYLREINNSGIDLHGFQTVKPVTTRQVELANTRGTTPERYEMQKEAR